MAEELIPRDYQAEADAYLDRATVELPPEEVALVLTVLANRVATRLHNLAHGESTARKGAPEWPDWAALQNAASIAAMILTTETLVTDIPEKEKAMPPAMPPEY